MSLRSPLSRAQGLGSAKEGVSHWWWERITSIALVLLGTWFVFSLVSLVGSDHATVVAWLGSPLRATMMILFVATVFFHGALGLQVVIEDYVHTEWLKMSCLIGVKLLSALLAVMAVIMVLQVAVGT